VRPIKRRFVRRKLNHAAAATPAPAAAAPLGFPDD
jgi:hypothetical protein